MGFWNPVVSVVSAVAGALVEAAEKLGPAVKETVDKLGPILSQMPGKIGAVARVVTLVSQVLGMFQKGDNVEDIGDRAIQGAEQGITPDGYETFDDYMDALRSVDLDPAKTERISFLDKVLAGCGVSVQGFSAKVNESPEVLQDFYMLIAKNPDFFTAERAGQYTSHFDQLGELVDFFKGTLDAPDEISVLDRLIDIERSMGNDQSNARDQLQDVLRESRA